MSYLLGQKKMIKWSNCANVNRGSQILLLLFPVFFHKDVYTYDIISVDINMIPRFVKQKHVKTQWYYMMVLALHLFPAFINNGS